MADDYTPNFPAIRRLLKDSFTTESLRMLCYEDNALRPIADQFGHGQGLEEMADEVIIYCDKQLLWYELFSAIATHNRYRYKGFYEAEIARGVPATALPPIPPADK